MFRVARCIKVVVKFALTIVLFTLFLITFYTSTQDQDDTRGLDAVWQQVLGSRYPFLVYSAYIENRTIANFVKGVRIIGAVKKSDPIKTEARCRFWFSSEGETHISESAFVKAKILPIRENWNMKFTACFIMCPIPDAHTNPTHVSVYSEQAVQKFLKTKNLIDLPEAGNTIRIQNPDKNEVTMSTMAACIKPLHYNFSKVWELIEWIELNKMLGIDHFYFYKHDVAENTSCVLNEYATQGSVTILDWNNLPLVSQKDIRTENMFAALNDCLYRGMYKHKYLAMLDVDEFIIPRENGTLVDFMQKSEAEKPNLAAAIFKNAFFYLQWPDNPNYKGLNLVTQKKTRRKREFNPNKRRTKFICKPELTVEVGNHFLWQLLNESYMQLHINPSYGFLHHYRNCESEGNWCINESSRVDNYMWKYGKQLGSQIMLVQDKIGKKCNLTVLNII